LTRISEILKGCFLLLMRRSAGARASTSGKFSKIRNVKKIRALYEGSADKARSLGWHGHVNSTESIFEVFREFEKLHMIPPVPNVNG
jgi:hypothetical protein